MNRTAAVVLAGAALLWANVAHAASGSFEVFAGNAYNFRSDLHITQDGGFSQSVRADYDTRGFRSPLYYALRAGRWEARRGWELSLIHHKLYLENPPLSVANVSISHGFNIVTVNRAFRDGEWTWRVGVGPVITHAEAVILGSEYHGPYKFAGAALLAGVGRRFYIGERFYLSLEGAASAAYAKPRLSGTPGGELTVRNVALHGLFGAGFDF